MDGLFSFSNYVVTVSASNIYTRLRSDATPVLNSMTCTTDEGGESSWGQDISFGSCLIVFTCDYIDVMNFIPCTCSS